MCQLGLSKSKETRLPSVLFVHSLFKIFISCANKHACQLRRCVLILRPLRLVDNRAYIACRLARQSSNNIACLNHVSWQLGIQDGVE